MGTKGIIRAGKTAEIDRKLGVWVFVDPGFAGDRRKTCGYLAGDELENLSFAEMTKRIVELVGKNGGPLNLVIEAPLSVAFSKAGNPMPRSMEVRDGKSRCWYVGLGCSVLMSACYLLRAISEAAGKGEVRLFEGFVSFKDRSEPSDHLADVQALKDVVWRKRGAGRLSDPKFIGRSDGGQVRSAFAVAGMDFGVPPVIEPFGHR